MHSLGELCTSSFVWECHVDSGLVHRIVKRARRRAAARPPAEEAPVAAEAIRRSRSKSRRECSCTYAPPH